MQLKHGLHLAYCTNIHQGESWTETLANLERYTLAVRQRVCPDQPYAIGLRLGDQASRELSEPPTLLAFQRWLDRHGCYVFTINGFPYGRFHGTRVKEQVYAPDWTSAERLEFTRRLFDLLVQLAPNGVEGSVSTVPGSFKEFIRSEGQVQAMRLNLWRCVEHLAALSERTGKTLHLGLEPEPLCFLETSEEVVRFFEQLRADRPNDPRLARHLGVNYDACHLAIQFEEPQVVVRCFQQHGVGISKIHLSSALALLPTPEARQALRAFADDVYLHQVVVRSEDGVIARYRDLDEALNRQAPIATCQAPIATRRSEEWRIHFHVPLHSCLTSVLGTTSDHLLGLLDLLQEDPRLCRHLEMETYTWGVLPPELRNRNVVDQLLAEYEWTLGELGKRELR